MYQVLRKALVVSLAVALGAGVAAAVAFAGPGNSPAITFATSSPVEGATLTSNSPTFAFSYNRTTKQTRSLVCSLSGPSTSLSAPCDHLVNNAGGAQADKSYSGLPNGSYTFTASLTLTDGGTASATRHFVINAPCSVVNTTTHVAYTDLAPAISAATAGDELDITGSCIGNYTVGKNLTLQGINTAGAKATLDGSQAGTVLTVNPGVVATLSTLRITHGAGTGLNGGGITSNGTLTVNDSTISGNTVAGFGGGLLNRGALTVNNSTISGNTAILFQKGEGGGIYDDEAGTVVLNDTNVTDNNASDFGGGVLTKGPHLTLNGTSTISGNTSNTGGGIASKNTIITLNDQSSVNGNTAVGVGGISLIVGTLTLNGDSTISNNTTTGDFSGAGVESQGAQVTLNDHSSISGNTAPSPGGGIANLGGTVTMNGSSSITGNQAVFGGGIVNDPAGTVTMNDSSSITGNTATLDGGGIFNEGTLTLATTGGVFDNTPDDIF